MTQLRTSNVIGKLHDVLQEQTEVLQGVKTPARNASASHDRVCQQMIACGRILAANGRPDEAISRSPTDQGAQGLTFYRPLGCLPVQGVDFLDTDVAQRYRRIVGGQTGP